MDTHITPPLADSSNAITLPRRPASQSTAISPEARLLAFSAIVFPFALIPFLALRRSLIGLHAKVDHVRSSADGAQRELKGALWELSVRKEEYARLQSQLSETRRELQTLRSQARGMETSHSVKEQEIRGQIQDLLKSRDIDRAHALRMRELGTSLADIAAFMQEVEIQQGFVTKRDDGRGIERLRRLALQLGASGKH
ncbi:hypothetical protein FA95DRAFT_1482569 [Auriscalpium vulgare]|uniref:Uncharacterized protein n=1 Tax=Auriscalpium vulgare TaxID=40419 RepID=A0ACB8SAX5_9AGAM|nr:hypothetical protein FA95DRAFT_1482569 [Auriscalpium vulgare]